MSQHKAKGREDARTAGVGEAVEGGGEGCVGLGGRAAAAQAAHELHPGSLGLGAGLDPAAEQRAQRAADGPAQRQEGLSLLGSIFHFLFFLHAFPAKRQGTTCCR